MARNQTRNLNSLLQLAGVVDSAKGPKISDDIQLSYLVSDLSELISPLPRPTFIVTASRTAVAAVRSRIELRAPPEASIRLTWWRNEDATIHTWGVIAATGITANLDTIDVAADGVALGADNARAMLQTGTGGLSLPIFLPANSETANKFPDLIVPPGDILTFVTGIVNTSIQITMAWIEVPVLADVV